jgi:surface antigen
MKNTMILAACFLLLAGCETTNQDRGAITGALVGGILGNQVGGGSGQTIATAAGVFAGAAVGAAVGARMDEVDRMKMGEATAHSLEYGASGETTAWSNPDTGNSGEVAPVRTYQNSSGQYCREFQQEIIIGGQIEQGYSTACRKPDGNWEIQGG